MTIRLFSGLTALALLSMAALAQPPSPAEESGPAAATESVPEPPLVLAPVPTLLRMHLPDLPESEGQLVQSVLTGSDAARLGLRPGDILLECNGRIVDRQSEVPAPDPSLPMVVLRRGRMQMLPPSRAPLTGREPRWPDESWGTEVQPNRAFPSGGVTASSRSEVRGGVGGRAVSISRTGDQISLEMSMPELTPQPVRFRGTLAQIQRELDASDLPTAAKNEVRSALGVPVVQ
ncbi:PDZ domain-containing protein [Roseiconus nitratireducens]|uniref:PDZ domain-containing protein n=1 Tax=Roseiconus nitratireducens TaxID=2605748 RepID=A0A5M6DHP1_9BACT|nr:PDZ domain-containing protein [Roseiconus nitratireducens]KAA5547064.1 PDZ domain-containing protein [Roseiconus nitratireducens]